ncbi:uncharacterized protein LOC135946220 [Cloeon dipterum]|uniref:uncharacterized protein LOC135946220 n=1 Tax=Cloeon dipterum TaxID=197152 RepID=UPI00321FFC8A
MRRSSYTPEPLIVVEEAIKEDDEKDAEGAVGGSEHASEEDYDDDVADPALLCPWRDPRDLRKRSLPTPSCTSGITASQVRRLSEGRQSEIAKESAFLATLTANAAAGGRRHSVTISKFPPTSVLNRGRRESFAAFPVSRRDSASFNLHLDIMDDIAEIKGARKAKLKIYKTDSREQVCEVEESGSSGSPVRFQGMSGMLRSPVESRRHSEAGGLASLVPPVAVQPKRKSSEQLVVGNAGIVCTNSDLRSLLSLTSSAQEINTAGGEASSAAGPAAEAAAGADEKRSRMKDSRSSSFDATILQDEGEAAAAGKSAKVSPASWFAKRHQPMAKKEEAARPEPPKVTFTEPEAAGRSKRSFSCVEAAKRLVWDRPSGSVVDAHILGSAIEDFLRRGSDSGPTGGPADPKQDPGAEKPGAEQTEAKPQDACEQSASTSSSICSTLKDLFVK